MIAAAEKSGLDAIGFADHCNVSEYEATIEAKREYGFNLDTTHERRRQAIRSLSARTDLTIYDAVEMDYDPRDETRIREFLAEAGFDYAIGSVHAIDGRNVQIAANFADRSDRECRTIVDRYYETLVSLIDSELFAIAAHLDLPERTPELRDYATEDHFATIADALERSRTVPEINAGRVLGDYGEFHPAPRFFEVLRERGISFVPGTDSHRPDELRDRLPVLAEEFDDREFEARRLSGL